MKRLCPTLAIESLRSVLMAMESLRSGCMPVVDGDEREIEMGDTGSRGGNGEVAIVANGRLSVDGPEDVLAGRLARLSGSGNP